MPLTSDFGMFEDELRNGVGDLCGLVTARKLSVSYQIQLGVLTCVATSFDGALEHDWFLLSIC